MSESQDRSRGDDRQWLLRLVACSLVLVALAVVQKPGYLVADTKLDLAVDPAAFLERALHLWDPQAAFGQVQNQAYGYFLPMGSWFLLGSALDVPGWLVQRLWLALVMVVAFVGVVRLARALGIGGPLSGLIAGFAYALSPRMISTLGPISVEAWPSAMVPWVLLPLVVGSRGGSPRRAAAWSALAIALTGGVNAAASAAVLPLGALWLLTRPAGPRRRALLLWWPLFTLLGTFWWLAPLFLLGSYSPPFLDFIENAAVTTVPATLFDALRGTSAWVPYIEPGWRAGNDLITAEFLILNSGVVMLLGVVGLARRDLPHRRFLLLGLAFGILLVTASHTGAVQGWFAAPLQALLDGPLAPLRNVHKYDAVIRLPMVLGLAHVLDQLRRGAAESREPDVRWWQRQPAALYAGVLSLSLVAVAGAAGPAWNGRLTPRGEFLAIPGYWQQAADWLAERGSATRTLLVPGTSFGTYVWGNPRDEPMQVLARSPWAVRDAIPLAPPGTIRMLDAVESRLADGRGSKGLAAYLRRAGISHLLVRNDLERGSDIPDPILVHQALENSRGIERVAVFGPQVGGEGRLGGPRHRRVLVNYGWQTTYRAIEIYAVRDAAPAAEADGLVVVAGGPESLLDLADHGVLDTAPTMLAVDAGRDLGESPLVLTDGLRRREKKFGRVHDSHSQTLAPGLERRPRAPAREYELADSSRWETRAELLGARSVTASSSMADVTALGALRQEWMPWSAFDNDERSQWVSSITDSRAWVELELSSPRALPLIRVTAGSGPVDATRQIRVVTDRGRSKEYEVAAGEEVTVPLPRGPTQRVRVEGRPGQRLALADIHVPGVDLARPLRMPGPAPTWPSPDVVLMSSGEGARSGCLTVESDTLCAPGRDQRPEEPFGLDRLLRLSTADDYRAQVTAAPIGGEDLESLIQLDQAVNASASSAAVDAATSSGLAAVDGSVGTTWVADRDDKRPRLFVSWLGETRIRGITLALDWDAAATPATQVTVTYPEGSQTVRLDRNGEARLRPIRTDRLELTLAAADPAATLQFDQTVAPLGIGVSELRLEGLDLLPVSVPVAERRYECGTGPRLTVNGVVRETRVVASPRDLYHGRDVPAEICDQGPVELQAGDNRVQLVGSAVAAGRSLLLSQDGTDLEATPPTATGYTADSPTRRVLSGLRRAGSDATVVVRENTNPGWVSHDSRSRPVVADGWQQGWTVPPGHGDRLYLRFAPDVPYRVGLAAGAVTLLILVLICLRRTPRHKVAPPSAASDAVPGVVMGPLALVVAGLVAGWVGLAVAVAAVAVSVAVSRFVSDEAWAWMAGVPVALAALVYAWRPLGSENGWAGALPLPQLLVLLSLVLLLAVDQRRGGFIPRNRMKGRSTKR